MVEEWIAAGIIVGCLILGALIGWTLGGRK